MKTIPRKIIVVAFASAAIFGTQALAQTVPTLTANTYVEGSYSQAAPKVVGDRAPTARLDAAVTVSGKIEQPQSTSTTNIKTGVTNIVVKGSFNSFAFGNKEILALVYETNKVSGASLVATNAFTNSFNTADYVLVALRSNVATAVPEELIRVNFGASAQAVSSTRTNGVATSSTASGYQAFAGVILDAFNMTGVASVSRDFAKQQSFGSGSSKVTLPFASTSLKADFSGVTPVPAPPEE